MEDDGMTPTQAPSGSDAASGYLRYPRFAENRSIHTWFTMWIGLWSPVVAFFCFVIGLEKDSTPLVVSFFVCGFFWLTSIGVRAYWGVGIRIDNAGIRIGGCKRTSRWWWHLWEKVRLVSGPSTTRPTTYTLFVPWDGITSVRVVTERKEMKQLIRKAPRRIEGSAVNNTLRYYWQVGAMVPFFGAIWYRWALRGFLVFDVDPDQAQVPEFRRPSRYYAMPPASTWMCPVRRPKRLRKALENLEPLLSR
jgi:hypothetical protein